MPRDGTGNYSPPLPDVVSGDPIEAAWANTTVDDISTALSDSLSRSGNGDMLVPLRFADGTVSAPGIAWTNEPGSGFYRLTGGEFRAAIANKDIIKIGGTNILEMFENLAFHKVLHEASIIDGGTY